METTDGQKLRQLQWERECKLEQAIKEAKMGRYPGWEMDGDYYTEMDRAANRELAIQERQKRDN